MPFKSYGDMGFWNKRSVLAADLASVAIKLKIEFLCKCLIGFQGFILVSAEMLSRLLYYFIPNNIGSVGYNECKRSPQHLTSYKSYRNKLF